jgi:hypothetical protein
LPHVKQFDYGLWIFFMDFFVDTLFSLSYIKLVLKRALIIFLTGQFPKIRGISLQGSSPLGRNWSRVVR